MYAIQREGLDKHFLLLAASSNFLNIFQILLLVDASSPYNGWILYSAGPVELVKIVVRETLKEESLC